APERIYRQGREICNQINAELRAYIRETYNVESKLELELEKLYTRFFLPSVRGAAKADNSGAAGPARGRAKGYAGLVLLPGETPRGGGLNMEGLNLEIVGMEAIRRDWTLLAREFQIKMLEMVFLKNSLETIQAHINHTIQELRAGHLDRKLVYVKALRKPAEEYTKTQPPHVKAAAQLEREQRHGLISFLWTKAGPQPAGRITAPIDYDHYVEKQLKPIASAFTEVLTTDVEHLINGNRQLWLF
ncbi:MAG TPA: DNA polymerase domain-containing protein, partial [Spirochaetia bacterium]|nr:DNA polymerase domain-containing protein [Spirochaetia bacterium]